MEHQEPTFHKFGELPKEIRLVIWEMAIAGPRVVDLREEPLKITYQGFKEQVQELKARREHIDATVMEQELWVSMLEDMNMEPDRQSQMRGFRSRCQAPRMLFACRESHGVGTKGYEQTFHTLASVPETWFDFHRDILYIRWDRFDY